MLYTGVVFISLSIGLLLGMLTLKIGDIRVIPNFISTVSAIIAILAFIGIILFVIGFIKNQKDNQKKLEQNQRNKELGIGVCKCCSLNLSAHCMICPKCGTPTKETQQRDISNPYFEQSFYNGTFNTEYNGKDFTN